MPAAQRTIVIERPPEVVASLDTAKLVIEGS